MTPGGTSPRWSVERRLDFVARRLAWERRVNRHDLVQRFGVSPNQATADLKLFAMLHPGALVYDAKAKAYLAGSSWDRPNAIDSVELLRELRLIGEGILPPDEGVLRIAPSTAMAELPDRSAPADVLVAVIAAIRDQRAISATYQSFSHPDPRRRTLEPHALVYDGFRWHARARDAETDAFKDFVLGRLSEVTLGGLAEKGGAEDAEWTERVALEIAPHPALSPHQRTAIEADYGMVNGRLVLEVRRAVLYYAKHRLGLVPGHEGRPAADQHIVLLRVRDLSGAPRAGRRG